MHFSLGQVLLVLPAVSISAAVPVNSTDIGAAHVKRIPGPSPCYIYAMPRDLWVEYGQSRWRTTFSATGIDPATYCQFWKDGTNIQCGWDSQVDGGWWRFDASFNRGPVGDQQYYNMLKTLRGNWIKSYGCTTG